MGRKTKFPADAKVGDQIEKIIKNPKIGKRIVTFEKVEPSSKYKNLDWQIRTNEPYQPKNKKKNKQKEKPRNRRDRRKKKRD